jgi:two-component system, chemotaxis family, CheB/CheR fusion protein
MKKSRPHQAKVARPRSGVRSLPAQGSPRGPGDFLVVGIGASAGGLDACRRFLDVFPAGNGMAFILVQHLDPTHESMMVDLLASHTSMTVRQATDGMLLEREHLYVIPPGTYLSIAKGALHLSQPQARHGARLPFDFLLHSLAEECGDRAICVILSGTGADGSLGLKAVKERCGFVIAQDPDEAGFDGMPRSAIMTGAVDIVLPAAQIADALVKYDRRIALTRTHNGLQPPDGAADWFPHIIDLLRTKAAYDFTSYKRRTLQRRIERRMAMAAVETDDTDRYVEILRSDTSELDLLAKDLLINVTGFFRDPKVFDLLAEKIVPELVRGHAPNHPIRIWVAGCSTGEETYSLTMLFREEITAAKRDIKLQVFASDVDPDAVASAREGLYPETIEADVSAERLARFFSKDDHGYRVLPELRATVVFTVQDVLADPPFSRLDLISCRNLLIYLRPEAQAKVVSLFHFALRERGFLLLGSSETVGSLDGRFEVISKQERLYQHVGHSRPGEFGFLTSARGGVRISERSGKVQAPSRQAALAELCRQVVVEAYAPAAVLINRKHECLYFLGPTDRYLSVAPGHPTHNLLAMSDEGLRTKLRSAIQRSRQENTRVVVASGQINRNGNALSFSIAAQPVVSEGEELLLICFIDEPKQERKLGRAISPRVAELEQELEATRIELQGAIHNLEISSEEQKAVNEEALSINEEYQSTNEELLTSKEELQSLNEELTALNSQLQETLERQRTTSNDLQNVLYSTDVATLFLDINLNIRFFTPATKSLFKVIPSDVGRPLADLHSLADDGTLPADARTVLRTLVPLEREIEARSGACYLRRILPYRTQENGVEGVVITFADITERKHVADALEAAKRQAELANVAKSRFLAAASHDLRQPLQTLALIHGLLEKTVESEKARSLVARADETLGAMSGMLNTLLDINQIKAGTVRAEMVNFPINDLLYRLRDEFTYHAQAQKLALRVVACGLSIHSDPRLLEQMIRNLLSNALKYTEHGKVLLGCRRREGMLSIEVWDTGVGIPNGELEAIFEEYHQLDNAARERSRGLGLGLSIVHRFGKLLDHRVHVRSHPGKGSVFAIEIMLPPSGTSARLHHHRHGVDDGVAGAVHHHTGAILVVEDDPEVRGLLELLLNDEGHHVATAPDGIAALELVARGTVRPDLILADYNLPNGMDGLQVSAKLREGLHHQIPVIILTGDISTGTLRDIARQDCVQLNKPVKLKELTHVIQSLLPISQSQSTVHSRAPQLAKAATTAVSPTIFVVDDDSHIREGLRAVLEADGRTVVDYASCQEFLDAYHPGREACLLIDAYLPGMNGLELLRRLKVARARLPAIMITGNSDVPMAVQAMKAGASDFIEKPVGSKELIACVERALEQSQDTSKLFARQAAAANRIAALTARQRQIMTLVLTGHPSKNIAADLGISQRTVENHRATIMKKTGSKSLPALARLALAAGSIGTDESIV